MNQFLISQSLQLIYQLETLNNFKICNYVFRNCIKIFRSNLFMIKTIKFRRKKDRKDKKQNKVKQLLIILKQEI